MAQESDKLSPMLKQYLDIKQKYSDYILFFRLGISTRCSSRTQRTCPGSLSLL